VKIKGPTNDEQFAPFFRAKEGVDISQKAPGFPIGEVSLDGGKT